MAARITIHGRARGRLERGFQQSLLTPRHRLQIDLTALLKADPDAFAAALLKLRQGGLITANEARAMLRLPAHANGESIVPPSVISAKPAGDKPLPSGDGEADKIALLDHHRARHRSD